MKNAAEGKNEVQQLGVLGDLNRSHFSWVLKVTAGLWGLEGRKAGQMLYILYECMAAPPLCPWPYPMQPFSQKHILSHAGLTMS